ncbi:MAG TPA: 2-C-methyl-D-erythritol 4-phosphate cytidylyltransferase [Phycisphaerae bacterium]|nr:2-C-methyl-D-erythritol 4-phosphate cytidylyltransferase [Phycisphaerae bacterium]
MRAALLIPAAGQGLRFGSHVKKPYIELAGRPVFLRTLDRFRDVEAITCRILVIGPDDLDFVRCNYQHELDTLGVAHLVCGGRERYDSVVAGLACVPEACDLVVVHDAVRPLVPLRAIVEALTVAERIGAACVGMPVHDTIKRVTDGDIVEETIPRKSLWAAQTPQVFRTALLRQAYERLHAFPGTVTDDAQLVEALGHPVAMVEGSRANIKITTPADLPLAEAYLAQIHEP